MKIVKRTLAFIGILIVLILIVAAFTEKNYAVEREVKINLSDSAVFDYVKLLKNQDEFSVWQSMDSTMKKEFHGVDGTVGFWTSWDSENEKVGKGEQEITNIVEYERIDFELRFLEPWESTDQAYIITENIGSNETLVKWGFNGKMNYPMNLTLLFMNMEEMLGPQLQEGLDKLKVILES